jgi:hypothetical protein
LPGLAITAICSPLNAASVEIRVDCDRPAVPLSPHLYGLFFEDINFGADGGLAAEEGGGNLVLNLCPGFETGSAGTRFNAPPTWRRDAGASGPP